MKTCKTSRSLSACLLALCALPVLAFSPATADAAKPKPPVIDTFNIKNATYREVVDMLRKESGSNIMLAPVLENEMAPEFVLRHVTVEGVLGSICRVTGLECLHEEYGDEIWFLKPQNGEENQPWKAAAKQKICRVFKASAKEKLASPQLDQLLANISDAARKACEVNARAQGRAAAEAPTIEAHAGTGILIVAGTESDVQLVGQVIQVLGGEVVPLTSSAMTLTATSNPLVMKDGQGNFVEFEGYTNFGRPVVATGKEGTRLEITGGKLDMLPANASAPVVAKDKEDSRKQLEVTGNLTLDDTKAKAMEDTRKQLEAARNQVNSLEKLLELLSQQPPTKVLTPPTPPTPPRPPKAK
ncbi:MAG: hypothetical protein ABJF10_22455 [Chthoniobacter sp.]|uniref:hypothetical protein n=1 Tax=Chthoniobacter sp. TaxID=2510640 RepID=UPI0032ADC628